MTRSIACVFGVLLASVLLLTETAFGHPGHNHGELVATVEHLLIAIIPAGLLVIGAIAVKRRARD